MGVPGGIQLRRRVVCVASLTMTVAHSAAIAQNAVIEEIITTATKRVESVQDVPVSVGVVTGDFIEKFDVKDLNDFQNYVPGLQVQSTFGSWAVRIRGLGSGITNLAFDSSVPVFNDGVYCGRGKCMESAFLDLERVEVARGPQGALFGKSTIAGAVSVLTAKPTSEFESYVKIGYEVEYGSNLLNGAISGPFSDRFRGRLAFKYEDTDGYIENPYVLGDEPQAEKYALRASFEWDLSDETLLGLKLETGNSETDGRSNQLVVPGLMTLLSSDPMPEFRMDSKRRVSTGVGREDYYEYEWSLATLNLDTQLGEHTLTGILGYWDYKNAWRLDVDGGPDFHLNTDLRDRYDQSSAELRLLSPTGQTVEYILGAWYQQSELVTQQFSPFSVPLANFFGGVILGVPSFLLPPESTGGVGMDRHFQRDTDAYSVYGQLAWNVSDAFRAILDLRYTSEEQSGIGQSFPSIFPDGVNPVHQGRQYLFHNNEYLFFQTRDDDSLDPSLRLQFNPTDDLMLYAVYAEGSKAGGLKANDGILGNALLEACADPVFCEQVIGQTTVTLQEVMDGLTLTQGNGIFDFEDEEAESVELGSKITLADGRAHLNIAAFTMQFDNLQTSSYDGTRFIIQNAASADVNGIEIEGIFQASDNLRLGGALAYIDATYNEFSGAQCIVDADNNPVDPNCVDGEESLAGERLERVPEWEANFTADWHSEIGNNLELLATVALYYSSDYFVRQDFSPNGRQSSFAKWDTRVAIADIDGRWEVGLSGRNLSNVMTLQHAYEILGDQFVSIGIGRTITLEGAFRF